MSGSRSHISRLAFRRSQQPIVVPANNSNIPHCKMLIEDANGDIELRSAGAQKQDKLKAAVKLQKRKKKGRVIG